MTDSNNYRGVFAHQTRIDLAPPSAPLPPGRFAHRREARHRVHHACRPMLPPTRSLQWSPVVLNRPVKVGSK